MRVLRRLILFLLAGSVAWTLASTAALKKWSSGPPPPARRLDGTERRVITSDGADLRVVELGHGPLVVLAHGINGRLDHWSPIAERIAEAGYRVVTYDQRGHHGSTMGSDPFSPHVLGRDLLAVIASCETTAAVVVGHSMGGIGIQGALAQGLTDVAAKLVIVSSVERPVASVKVSPRGAAAAINLASHPKQGQMMMRGGFGKSVHTDDLEELQTSFAAMDPEAFAAALTGLASFDFSEELRACEADIRVICGTRDLVTPIVRSRRIAELAPNAQLIELQDVGHMTIWEATDAIVETVLATAIP